MIQNLSFARLLYPKYEFHCMSETNQQHSCFQSEGHKNNKEESTVIMIWIFKLSLFQTLWI